MANKYIANQPGIENPHDHDVLCGRGGAAFKHVGNYTFRYLVQLNKVSSSVAHGIVNLFLFEIAC